MRAVASAYLAVFILTAVLLIRIVLVAAQVTLHSDIALATGREHRSTAAAILSIQKRLPPALSGILKSISRSANAAKHVGHCEAFPPLFAPRRPRRKEDVEGIRLSVALIVLVVVVAFVKPPGCRLGRTLMRLSTVRQLLAA